MRRKYVRPKLVELWAFICPRCRCGYTVSDLSALEKAAPGLEENLRACRKCGAIIDIAGERDPWIVSLDAWRETMGDERPPGRIFDAPTPRRPVVEQAKKAAPAAGIGLALIVAYELGRLAGWW